DRVAGRGESLGAVGFQRFRLGRVAVPHVDVLAVVEHAADEAGAHQAGAEKCDSHGFLLKSAPTTEKCASATGGYWGEYCAKGPGRSLRRRPKIADSEFAIFTGIGCLADSRVRGERLYRDDDRRIIPARPV